MLSEANKSIKNTVELALSGVFYAQRAIYYVLQLALNSLDSKLGDVGIVNGLAVKILGAVADSKNANVSA